MATDHLVIRTGDTPVTLVNVFTVEPTSCAELVRRQRSVTEDLMRHRPGFVGTAIHVGDRGDRVVNYAQWRRRQDLQDALADEQVRAALAEVGALAEADPQVHRVAAVYAADGEA